MGNTINKKQLRDRIYFSAYFLLSENRMELYNRQYETSMNRLEWYIVYYYKYLLTLKFPRGTIIPEEPEEYKQLAEKMFGEIYPEFQGRAKRARERLENAALDGPVVLKNEKMECINDLFW